MRRFYAHLSVILSLVVAVLVIFHRFNPLMGFLDNLFTHILLLLLCVVCALPAVLTLCKKKRK